MDLKTYLRPLSSEERESFATKCGTTLGHMQNVAYGTRVASTELAVAIEQKSGGKVTRREQFPDSYAAKWPELAKSKKRVVASEA